LAGERHTTRRGAEGRRTAEKTECGCPVRGRCARFVITPVALSLPPPLRFPPRDSWVGKVCPIAVSVAVGPGILR
jgi:hypothetical protein